MIDALADGIDPTGKAKSIEQILAENANDAIAQGADVDAVNARLSQMVGHLRSNRGLSDQANQALAAGADPRKVSGRIWQMAQSAAQQRQRPMLAQRDVTTFPRTPQAAPTNPAAVDLERRTVASDLGFTPASIAKVGHAPRPTPPEKGEHLPGQSGNFGEDVLEGAMGMATAPGSVAKSLILTPFELGGELANWKNSTNLPQAKQVLIKTLQTAAIGGSGAAEEALGRLVGPVASKLLVGAGAGATFTPERPTLGAALGLGTAAAHAAPEIAGAVVRPLAGDFGEGMMEAGARGLQEGVTPTVNQPQPLTGEQQALRARLASEGINPSGPIRRRVNPETPPVEPPPEAQAYSTKSTTMIRRPKPPAPEELPPWSGPPPELAGEVTPEIAARRAELNTPEGQNALAARLLATPEQRAAFRTQYEGEIDKRWQAEVAQAKQMVGPLEFQRQVIAAAKEAPEPGGTLATIQKVAHDIVTGEGTAHFPPTPKPGDLTPVVSANGEFETRPGIMRAINKGEQPSGLSSLARLPEPTAADVAAYQPEGYKKISPEEVAARKPEPIATEEPKPTERQAVKVDDQGLYLEPRTPSGALRDFRTVSTDGLIKAQRELMDNIQRDQGLAAYRTIENENMSGTGDRTMFQAATKTERGTSQQAEAAQRLRAYEKVQERLSQEFQNRGLSSEDIYNHIQSQEELEQALEREATYHGAAENEAEGAFDFGPDTESEGEAPRVRAPRAVEHGPSDILNVAKLNLADQTAQQRMAAKLEEFRNLRDQNRQTFAEADVDRNAILNELRAGDPKALPTDKAKRLSGTELLARRDLVRENDTIITELSKRIEQGLPPEEHAQASALLQKAVDHNDALLSDLVSGSSQKGRDLNLLRRMAANSLDPDVWRVQAKRMLGDRPLTAEIDAMIRKLAADAEAACR